MRNLRRSLSVVLLVCLLLSVVAISGAALAADSAVILARDAEWRYLDNGVNLGTGWSAPDYNDSAWKKGKSPLGFGDDFSETDPSIALATTVGYGKADDKNMTTYFRTTVNVNKASDFSALEVFIHVDDGAVVYVNGVEAFRRGIVAGPVSYGTGAKFSPKEETFQIPSGILKNGANTIAAEVHQDDGSSSDLWFEMSIKGVAQAGAALPASPAAPKASAADATTTAPTTVSKVTVTLNGNPTSAKGFTWYTASTSLGNDLQVVERTGIVPDFTKAAKFSGRSYASTNSPKELVHKAEATGLKADTSYFFRVGDAALGLWSNVGSFQTAPNAGPFTFIDLADSQAKSEDEADLSAQTFDKALATVTDAEFIVLNGDLVDTGINEGQWTWLFGHSQASLLNTTFVPAAGNHEEAKSAFIDHFDLKPAANSDTVTGAYYSFDYGKAHFIVLNNNEDSPEYADFTPAQIEWLKLDAQAARTSGAKWIIVTMHKGPYTTSNHATDVDIMGANGVRTKVAPIFSQLGVDLVLQGHDHIYARTKPISGGVAKPATKVAWTLNGQPVTYVVKPEGTIYLIPNTAGPKVYYKNTKIDPNYYSLFEVADESHAAVYGPDPGDPTRPVRSQVQNFVAITVDGDKLTAVTYEIDQNKNNAKPYIIDQFGIIK